MGVRFCVWIHVRVRVCGMANTCAKVYDFAPNIHNERNHTRYNGTSSDSRFHLLKNRKHDKKKKKKEGRNSKPYTL